MDSKIKKWIMVMLAVLVISAAAAGFMPEWKKTSAIGKGKDYVAEIRIDGTIYGGPRNGTLLGASEGVSSEQVMYEMEQARKDNRVKGVLLRINSPGGSVTDGMAIYDTMQYIKCDVSTICMGMAASMGAFLLSSGAKGKRICLPNAEVMIHQPLGRTEGQATEIEIAANHILQTKKKLNSIMAENCGKTVEELTAATDRDNWLTAKEALDFGLVDKVIDKR